MLRLAIIADDLTGSLDTGIKFSKRGIPTQVITDYRFCPDEVDQTKEVLVIDTETRHVHEDEAYAKVYRTVKTCQDMGITCFYKKTDSALRGHIGSELAALYDVLGEQIAFVPALPAENRITKEGIHYINGIPVADSIFGKDPLNPVRNSRIDALIHEESILPVGNVTWENKEDNLSEPILVYDASTHDDLEEIALLLKADHRLRVSAGCAGFAEVLASVVPFSSKEPTEICKVDRLVVLCGSINDVSRKQILYAQENGCLRISLSQEQKLAPGYLHSKEGESFLEELKRACRSNRTLLIDVFSEDTVGDARAYALQHEIPPEEIPERIAIRLGEIGKWITGFLQGTALLVIGGDTLYSLVQKLRKPVLDPVCEPAAGTVCMNVVTEDVNFLMISKSGGFGKKELIIDIANHVLKENGGINNEEELS